MYDEKIIPEQGPPDGYNLNGTAEPEVVPALEGNNLNGAAAAEPLEGDAPADGSSGDVPLSDEGARVMREPFEKTIPSQKTEEVSDADVLHDSSSANAELIAEVTRVSSAVSGVLAGISSEIHELHKLYHNEFAGRLKSMQDELDRYHDADRGNTFDGILSAIARIYVNNESLTDEISDPKTRKNVKYMLLDLSDLLEEYGVLRLKSETGEKRNVRHCQIVERIPTDNPELHDTIAVSHSTGFYKGNRTIIKELVDVYFFDKRSPATSEDGTDIASDADIHAEVE